MFRSHNQFGERRGAGSELRRRHTLFGRQRRRETLQRGSASSSRSASSLKRAAERPRSVLASPTPCTTPDAQSTAVIGPLTSYLVPARSTASGIRSPRHLCRQRPPPRPCSPSPHCSHYILITSEDYPRPRHAQRISSSNLAAFPPAQAHLLCVLSLKTYKRAFIKLETRHEARDKRGRRQQLSAEAEAKTGERF